MNKVVFIICILCLTLLSIGFKLKLTQPNQTAGYANMLCFMKAWEDQGVWNCHASPTYTFDAPGDKFISYFPGPMNAKGNGFYTSFPPFSFLLCYSFLKVFHLSNSVVSLLYLNFLLHILSSLFGLLFVYVWLRDTHPNLSRIAALLTFAGLLFTPILFHFFSAYFFIENIAFCLWLLASLIALIFLQQLKKNNIKPILAFLFYLLLSVLCYTELIGFILGLVLILIVYLQKKELVNYHRTIARIAACLFIVGIGIIVQYSSIAGVSEFLFHIKTRITGRSGWFGETYSENAMGIFSSELYLNAWYWLKVGYFPMLVLLVGFGFSLWIHRSTTAILSKKFSLDGWLLLLAPISIHTLVFLNANLLHEQLIVKWGFPISVLVAIVASFLITNNASKIFQRTTILLVLGFLLNSYLAMSLFVETDFEIQQKKLSKELLLSSRKTQSIVLIIEPFQYYFAPNLFIFSGRTIGMVKDKSEINKKYPLINKDSLLIYKINEDWAIVKIN